MHYIAEIIEKESLSLEGGTLKLMNSNGIDLSTFMILCYLVWLGVLAG